MRRRSAGRGLAVVLAASLTLAGVSRASAAPERANLATPDEQYQEAVRTLAEQRPDEASQLLVRFLDREPQHAGAWLDLAISQCALGHAAEAERLFRMIEQRFAPPPGILDVIQYHRAKGCNIAPARRAQLALTLVRRHDSNVNQGPSNRFFSTGIGNTTLELAPGFLPQSDSYAELSAHLNRPLDAADSIGIVQLRARRHDTLHQQDSSALLLGLERAWRAGEWQARGTAALGLVRLGSELYQRQSQLQLRVTPPLPLPAPFTFWLNGNLSHASYPTRSTYNANTLELGAGLAYRAGRTEVQSALAMQSDRGASMRPGGNRQGWHAGVQIYSRLSEKLNGEFGWARQDWRGALPYSPGLIDDVRSQATRQLRAALSLALRPQQTLQLEWRRTSNHENISLFQYNSKQFQLSWRWDQ